MAGSLLCLPRCTRHKLHSRPPPLLGGGAGRCCVASVTPPRCPSLRVGCRAWRLERNYARVQALPTLSRDGHVPPGAVSPPPLCGLGSETACRSELVRGLHLKMTGHSAHFARDDMRCTAWRPTPPELLDSGWGKCRSGFLGFFVTIPPQCGGGGLGGCAFTLVAAAWVPVALGVVDRCLLPPGGRLVCGCQAWRNR